MKTFEKNKDATDIGIDTTRKFIVVNGRGKDYKVGDIVELERDDNSTCPYFILNGKIESIYWKDLYYADNTILAHGQVFQKVYVSDRSLQDALERKKERILIHTSPGGKKDKYIVVNNHYNESFITGGHYLFSGWVYIAEIPLSPTTKKVTVTIDGETKEIEISEEELNKLLDR